MDMERKVFSSLVFVLHSFCLFLQTFILSGFILIGSVFVIIPLFWTNLLLGATGDSSANSKPVKSEQGGGWFCLSTYLPS